MRLYSTPRVFKDKNGQSIRAGDILFRKIFVRRRQRPGHRRIAIDGMSGREEIVSDEGRFLKPEQHWITRKVGWAGACMVAERADYSDFQAIMGHSLFDEDGKEILEKSAIIDMSNVFDSTVYEIKPTAYSTPRLNVG